MDSLNANVGCKPPKRKGELKQMKHFLPEGWSIDTVENRYLTSSPSSLYEVMNRGGIVEGRAVMCDFDHNLVVELGCMKGIIPRSEGTIGITEGKVKDIALISRVGKPVCFTVTAIIPDENGKLCARLSRKSAQEKCRKEYIEKLSVGDIIGARVTHLEPFGAFCDIGCGVVALLPIDAISVSRISHPADRFSTGDDIKAVVKAIDENGRITLSQKELLGSWEQNAALFSQGQTVSGIVRSVESYGVFVELSPNLAGLAELKNGVEVGMTASVYIKSLIPEKMKVKLIIVDAFSGGGRKEYKYFCNDGHINYWRYSPESCDRVIETDFTKQPRHLKKSE